MFHKVSLLFALDISFRLLETKCPVTRHVLQSYRSDNQVKLNFKARVRYLAMHSSDESFIFVQVNPFLFTVTFKLSENLWKISSCSAYSSPDSWTLEQVSEKSRGRGVPKKTELKLQIIIHLYSYYSTMKEVQE